MQFMFLRYVSVGDIARVGCHSPNVAAVYKNVDKQFALPVGYDLVRTLNPPYSLTPLVSRIKFINITGLVIFQVYKILGDILAIIFFC